MSRIAVTGGTGFVGGHVAGLLRDAGHDVVVIGRRTGIDITDERGLVVAFRDVVAVIHCAGINRELGSQTYQSVHVQGTAAVVAAARQAGVQRLVVLSFLRARPGCDSPYHESKWAAEEIVRHSSLTWTLVKAGVIYGRGDHLLDHLSRSFRTFPVFGLVGMRREPWRLVAPVAVQDVARLLIAAALGDQRLSDRTVFVLGPDRIHLDDAIRRVASVVGRRPVFMRLPIAIHRLLARVEEQVMVVPLLSVAQVRILDEGVVEPLPFADPPPGDLSPRTRFSPASIRAGLPPARRFGLGDLRIGR